MQKRDVTLLLWGIVTSLCLVGNGCGVARIGNAGHPVSHSSQVEKQEPSLPSVTYIDVETFSAFCDRA
ncbi:MAG: hypothetical protein AB7G75_24845 [Candidatus Binatia bacterium]